MPKNLSETSAIHAFLEAIAGIGITPPRDIIADGKLHRFATDGNPRKKKTGWYALHLDGKPAGVFGDWRTGITQTWVDSSQPPMTQVELEAFNQRVKAAREAARAEQEARHKATAMTCQARWDRALPAPDSHAYLAHKGVHAHGLREEPPSILLVPVCSDLSNTKIQTLQTISAKGEKFFVANGKAKGGFFAIGDCTTKPPAVIVVCEGFATGATIHEATKHPVIVGFNAMNLQPVCVTIRRLLPDTLIVVAGDDDWKTEGNPGLTSAKQAALSVGGLVAVPRFGPDRGDKKTDFNDMATAVGLDAVAEIFGDLIDGGKGMDTSMNDSSNTIPPLEPKGQHSEVTLQTSPTPTTTAEPSASESVGDAQERSQGVRNAHRPRPEDRPCYKVFDEHMDDDRAGVWYFAMTAEKKDQPPMPVQTWICAPLHLEALTHDPSETHSFGVLLRFKDSRNKWRRWAMPKALLAAVDAIDVRRALLDMGLRMDTKARFEFAQYLNHKQPKKTIVCTDKTGWIDGKFRAFVLPNETLGPDAHTAIFQSENAVNAPFATAGSLKGWQDTIGAWCVGNPMLTLSVCAAFVGPLLGRIGAEGGGIHLIGESSTGKTSALLVACSVWGGHAFKRSWRTTSNGLEAACAMSNDVLLAIDEISECLPKEIGAIVYSLTNGSGKQRANRSGLARPVASWRSFILSSGERSVSASMAEGGSVQKAGQMVRLLDVPIDRAYGAWDSLHHFQSGAAFSDGLKHAAATNYGHAGKAFIDALSRDRETNFTSDFAELKTLPEFQGRQDAEGQVKRAAERFAAMAFAGELASMYGVTPWKEGAAIEAAIVGFEAWLKMREGGTSANAESLQIERAIRDFVERHGDSRFSSLDGADSRDVPIRDRAGWWRQTPEGKREYLFNSSGMREALKGFDFNRALDELEQLGFIGKAGADGKRARKVRTPQGPINLYAVSLEW